MSSSTSSEDTVVDTEGTGSRNPRARHTRSGAARRQQQETTLWTAMGQMQLLTDPSGMRGHEAILHQMVGLVELDHLDYVEKEGLDITAGPEATYMKDIRTKVERAIMKQRKKMQIGTGVDQSMGAVGGLPDIRIRSQEEELDDHMSSVSQRSRSSSISTTSSKGKVLQHKIRQFQNKISAKASAISNAIAHPGITDNPRAVTKAGMVWSTIEHIRCEYQALLDEACESLEAGDIEAILKVDDELL